jgi:hypothetical protein
MYTVRLEALDGGWETCGQDRFPGVVPETVSVASNPAGHDTCSFQLKRDPDLIHPDLTAFTPCEIEEEGVLIFEGRVQETPSRSGGDDESITVNGRGWQYHLDDDVFERSWVHASLTDWQDTRSKPGVDLTVYRTSGQVEAGNGVIVLGWAQGADMQTGQRVGVTLDLREADAKRVVVELEHVNMVGNPFTIACVGHDLDDAGAAGASNGETYWSAGAPGSGFQGGSTTSPHRYVTIWLNRDSAPGAAGADRLYRIKSIKVFRQAAYESGNASVLKATDVLEDALPYAPLLSQDTSEIQATSFNIPDFAAAGLRTPREYGDAANAFHRYRLRLRPGKQLQFGPFPSAPKFKVGDWGGFTFEDTSANSGEEIYNRCVIEGTGPDGQPLRVSRYAAQLAGAPGDQVPSPAFPNPSAAVDATGWAVAFGSLTRDTGVFDSAPAGFALDPVGAETATTNASGTFVKGTFYRVTFRYRTQATAGKLGDHESPTFARFGDYLNRDYVTIQRAPYDTTWRTATMVWLPQADRSSGVQLQIQTPLLAGAEKFYFDSVFLEVVRPTLADRRGFLHTKILQVSNAIDADAAQQIADVFLQSHQRTPLRGTLAISPGAVRDFLTDEPIHPRRFANESGELLHLAHLIDPDTGAHGRDGVIAGVSGYDPDTEQAAVTIDSTRDNLEALLQRYAVVTGGT